MLDFGTNKRGLIVYGGESSTDYGIVVSEAPSFDKPVRKNTVNKIPGRNGAVIFQEDAYEDVTRSYKAWIADYAREDLVSAVSDFTAWLYSKKGYQRLEDNFEPDIYRLAYFDGGENITNELTQYGSTVIRFTCRPERFLKEGEKEITVGNGDSIYNPTRFESKPLIYIEGSGEIHVSIKGTTIVANVDDYIYIDCERMNAYRLGTENKNGEISGTFPIIVPGTNGIGITGSATKVVLVPRYFTI